MIPGFDYLFLAHKLWPVADSIKITPAGSAIGFFDDVVGDPIPHLLKFLASKKFPAYRVHMHYNGNHQLVDINQLKKRLPQYERIAKEYPNVKFYISHTCEYMGNDKAGVRERIRLINTLAPSCLPVHCGNVNISGINQECHVAANKLDQAFVNIPHGPYIISSDGFSITQLDAEWYQRKGKDATICFAWASRFNFRDASDPIPAPADRTATPDAKYLRAIARLLQPKEPAPALSVKGKLIAVTKPLLWKCFAEDCPKDPRGNKPAFLFSKLKASSLTVVDCHGKAVATLGLFPRSDARYYSGTGSRLYGYEMADKAKKQSGSPYVWVKNGSTYYGPIHPAYRQGYF